MGWGSGGLVFDAVAGALIEARASDDLMRRALGRLIDQLRDCDWDTEDDSLERFRDVPVIVELFRDRGVTAECRDQGPHALPCTRNLGHLGDHIDDNDNAWCQAQAKGA